MNNALHKDLGWFWYYWLFTTESVDESIEKVSANGSRALITVREDGQMPAPVVLKVVFAPGGPPIKPRPNGVVIGDTATVTFPVDVWFAGGKTFTTDLDFGGRRIVQVTLDPHCRFPDRDPSDNVWPRKAGGALSSVAGRRAAGTCAS